MKNKIILASLLGMLSLTAVQAEQGVKWSTGINVGTLGVGINVAYKFNNFFKVRGIGNYLQLNKKINADDFNIDGKLRLFTAGLLGDFHFFENGFRMTGGVVYNGNRANINAKASRSFTIHGRTYTPQQIGDVNGSLDFRHIAPYIGVGYDSGHTEKSGFSFTADVGVLFQGKVRGTVNSITGLSANDPQAINDVKDEIVEEANKRALVKMYPVVSLGVNYRF